MKVLLFAGSLRKDSLNKKLVRVADSILQKMGGYQTTVVDLQMLNFPLYDGDIEARGIPESVQSFAKNVAESDVIIISSPEYNGSISSPLKNTIDWTSRVKPMPFSKKPVLMLGASPGALGSMRALIHARQPLEALGNFVYPQPFGLSQADKAFAEDGQLKESTQYERLEKLIGSFLDFGKKLK